MKDLSEDSKEKFNFQQEHADIQLESAFDLRELAIKYHLFPLGIITENRKKKLKLAMRNPADHAAIQDVQFKTGMSVIAIEVNAREIHWLIQTHYLGRKLSAETVLGAGTIVHDTFQQLEMATDTN